LTKASQMNSDVTPDAAGCPATANHPGHDPPHVGPRDGIIGVQH
jgi:hypothetical protein